MSTVSVCQDIYVDHYVLFFLSRSLLISIPHHRCATIHEVDVSKDRFLTIWHFFEKQRLIHKCCNALP